MTPTSPNGPGHKQGVVMIRILVAGIVAAVLFGGFLVASGATTTEALSTPAAVKGDRLDIKQGVADCTQATWPYYEARCLRSTVTAVRHAQQVRVVAVDRRK